jgi:hypothetical protein
MKLALLLLCHEPPVRLAHRLAMHFYRGESIKLYIHYDGNRPESDLLKLTQALPADLQWRALRNRVACRWGEYSLVEATRRLIESALTDTDFGADHLQLCSGSCVPIRPLSSLQAFLAQRPGIDFIQVHDIARSPWVKDGLEEERFRYYFPLNFLRHRRMFDRLTAWQRRLGVRREIPGDLRIHFGSQWFCLTRPTAQQVLEGFERPGIVDFFRRCWIPDEFAIQSLVAAARKPQAVAGFPLTYYEFDDAGRPLVLDNGHEAHLAAQPFFFARKVAPEARGLIDHLDRVTAQAEADTGYFDRVGMPTVHYQRFLLDVQLNRGERSHVGTIVDEWRGPMDTSRRRYYVLVGSSRRHLMAVLARASSHTSLPIFCFPFDRPDPLIAAGSGRHYGLQPSDGPRRDHDPCAYLHELVHVDPRLPAAFGLDAAQDSWAKNFVPWDSNATLIDCDPPDLNADQRAAAALLESDTARDAGVVQATLSAVLAGLEPPRSLHRQLAAEGKHTCHQLVMADLAPEWGDATLRALCQAWLDVDAAPYFPSRIAASSMIWQQ